MKEYYSVAELLELNLTNLPKTRKGLDKFLSREQWKYIELPSRGIGGKRKEYALPDEFKNIVLNKVLIESTKQELTTDVSTTVESAAELLNWQREIAEARLIVVRYIQKQVKNGLKKTHVIQSLIDNNVNDEVVRDYLVKANAKAGEGRTVSRRTLMTWTQLVDDAELNNVPVISVLAPKARRVEIPGWATALLKLWSQPQKPTLTAVLEQLPNYLTADQCCPTYMQAYRFLNEKIGNVEVNRGRMGSREIKNLMPFVRRDTEQLMPTDVYTADGHCFDAEVAHPMHGKPFRPEITSIIDVATRRVVGWSIDLAESGWAVLDAIRMSCCECGIPAIFYVDNGSGYKNQMMGAKGRGVLARLNTELSHALPYNSQAKGLIERSHQTLWVKAAKNLPTYIGKDMDAEAGNKVHKLTRSEIVKFGRAKALMSWQDFLLYAAEVVTSYNNRPHSSLPRITDPVTFKKRHMTPLEMWNKALEMGAPIDRVEDWDKEDLFRPYEERKVRRGEVELFGNRYFSNDLSEFHGDSVLVGYDIHDADRITVRTQDGEFICHAYWNANKRNYFPMTKVEQARQRRADGRLRRLAVRQEEVRLEASPNAVIEHMQQQVPVVNFPSNREVLMQELDALEAKPKNQNLVFFKPRDVEPVASEDDGAVHRSKNDKVNRWIELDKQLFNEEVLNEEDQRFWEFFQTSKKFGELKEDDAELKQYLSQRRQA